MVDSPNALFVKSGDQLVPSLYTRGPWDDSLQHGGAVSGALGWAAQAAMDKTTDGHNFVMTRLTVEILRPVPVKALDLVTRCERLGRRARVITTELWADSVMKARSSSQWVLAQPGSVEDQRAEETVPARPTTATDPGAGEMIYPRPGFNCDAFELRCLEGNTEEPGPGVVWIRPLINVVADHSPDPVSILSAMADLGNAIGWEPSPRGEPMINPDLTLQLFRYPRSEWVCLQSQSRHTSAGIGMMETILWDDVGQIGRVLASTVENPAIGALNLP